MEFEKDDDLHMAFITAASNLRARNYGIEEVRAYTASDALVVAVTDDGVAGIAVAGIAVDTSRWTG